MALQGWLMMVIADRDCALLQRGIMVYFHLQTGGKREREGEGGEEEEEGEGAEEG